MYGFLAQNLSVRTDLENKFQATIKERAFNKKESPYLLIDLPVENQTFTINNKKMVTLEHHFTIPEEEDKNSSSIYHYTLVLQDLTTNKKYKTHLFFDHLDRITLEPKLFSDDEKFIMINNSDMKKICSYSLFSTNVILFIRDAQKNAIMSLIENIDATEIELSNLSKDLSQNKKSYIDMIHIQIESLHTLQSTGYTFRKNEIKFYQKLIQMLNETPIDSPIIEKTVSNRSKKDNHLKEIKVIQTEKLIANTSKSPQRERRKNKKSDTTSNLNLIKAAQQSILEFDESPNPESALIKNMINKIVELRSIELFSAIPNPELFELKVALKTRISDYLKTDLFLKHQLYLLAVNAQIMPLSDEFILEILKKDDVNLLKKVLNFNLIANSAKINLLESNQNFTLVEWSVHFIATKCFNCLLDNKFSMDFINEENTPYVMLLDNPSKLGKFLYNSNLDTIVKLYNRILAMLKKRAKSAKSITNGDEELITLKIEQIKVVKNTLAIFRKDQRYRFVMNDDPYLYGLNPNILEAAQNSIEYQKSRLNSLKAEYDAYCSMPIKYLLSHNREQKSTIAQNAQNAINNLNSMSTDLAIKKMIEECNASTLINTVSSALRSGTLNPLHNILINTHDQLNMPPTIIETNETDNSNYSLPAFNTLRISNDDQDNVILPRDPKNTKKKNSNKK